MDFSFFRWLSPRIFLELPTVIVSFVFIAGCTTSAINLPESGSIAQGEGIVFGAVRLIGDGEEKKLSSVLGESLFGLFVTGVDTSDAMFIHPNDKGDFAWHLPNGKYQINGFEWRSGIIISGPIEATFQVHKDRITYIGTLVVVLNGSRYAVTITDNYDRATKMFATRFPFFEENISKELMDLEERR